MRTAAKSSLCRALCTATLGLATLLSTVLPAEDGGGHDAVRPHPALPRLTTPPTGGPAQGGQGGGGDAATTAAGSTPATPGAPGADAAADATADSPFTIFPLKSSGNRPQAICTGPDGNLWVTEVIHHQIVKVTPQGEVTEYPVPEKNCGVLQGIAAGSDGQIYFTSREENTVRTISTAGKFGAQFEIPSAVANYIGPTKNKSSWPREIAPGPDGKLWFAEKATGKLANIDNRGSIQEYKLPAGKDGKCGPYCVVTGPDKNVWFTDWDGQKIGNYNPAQEKFSEWDAPSGCREITVGPDKNLWLTGDRGNKIGKLTPTGELTEYAVPTADAGLIGITAGSDGAVWFCEFKVAKIGRITMGGKITEYPIPVAKAQPFCLTNGPDKNIWVALQANAVARLDLKKAAGK